MTNRLRLILFILVSIALSSCSDEIELQLDNPKPVLVIDGFISDLDTTHWVRLSNLENYFSDKTPDFSVYKSASVTLLENNVKVATYSFIDSTSRFETRYQGVVGNNYQIDVVLPNGKHYRSASETIQKSPPIDSIWYEINPNPGGPGPQGEDIVIKINTQEPPGIGDSYQWKAYINNAYQYEVHDLNFANDDFVDGRYINNLEVYGISMGKFNTFKYDSSLTIANPVFVRIEQLKISSRYYDYLFLIFQQTRQVGGPFAAPPAEIKGNVYEQGVDEVLALGYFYACSIESATVEITE